jgi:GT2 family glycosyltransferase
MNSVPASPPKISVIVLNYNGQKWLPRCLESLEQQTIFNEIEVIVVDNQSPDQSAEIAAARAQRVPNIRLLQTGANLYFCGGNNRGAAGATGKYLFFINNDTWLERDCLEILHREIEAEQAAAGMPLVLNYDDDTYQSLAGGLDIFGMFTGKPAFAGTRAIIGAFGASYFVRADIFRRVGGFDEALLMYVDEADLSWRIRTAGGRIVGVPAARMHHRGSPTANPAGGGRLIELRTTETKRFLSNRNNLVVLMKNARNILLLLVLSNVFLLGCEALVSLVLIRNWRFTRHAYFGAIAAAFQMRDHIAQSRRQIRTFRQSGDLAALKFMTWRLNRWGELRQMLKLGIIKVDKH